MTASTQCIFFEPWNLGDALIAVAVALQDPTRIAVACNSRWHPLIRLCLPQGTTLELIPTDLDYVNRDRLSNVSFGSTVAIEDTRTVLSIRGDPRDYLAAKRLFPKSRIRMTGWYSFLARRLWILDIPFALGWAPVRNRYRAWAKLAVIPFEKVAHYYDSRRITPEPGAPVVIHVGAQWRAKQFPLVEELRSEIQKRGVPIEIAAGPKDPLPKGVAANEVRRLTDGDLVREFQRASVVVSNDSGPMHLAALLGKRTFVLVRTSNIAEWIPPGVVSLKSEKMPRGYRPDSKYDSDEILGAWPETEKVFDVLFKSVPK